ncbi:ABC transporter ATP-binding protein [Vallicoccus soli]|uniref:sn-glycerol-3-phosphate ABC transporter ATP-binding protein UgpC n=1 Tax=Vallicoccus soli TaxID=2339232 RepID=A0A3A3ZMP4_9ACTN|nr:sn-glycerol-3-phosphate ABC transporter ATP-binding protein UgpC [Vallicoccus soli]RJK97975.1 sn-glycerol-3-phosphate ABC transporter ATP-binding protein UgpC [Vallicoccus soli]
MASIEMRNIVKKYGDGFPAVNDVSLDIADGEFVILVGPSGCGKSTLLRMIVGLEDITSGDMVIGGKRVNDKAPRDRNLSMVFQNYALYPHLSVFENIAFPLRLAKLPDDEVRRRVNEAADVLELHEHLERKPANLSGGQRQRVAMGRAIVRQAEAFLFDEPLSNLDAKLRGQMRTEISRLQRRLGITTVYVTHDQTEAMTLGDRVAVLRKGVLQQVASPRELYEQPVNLFVAGFIGSPPMNFLPATLDGTRLSTPFGPIDMAGRKGAEKLQGKELLLVGIRPEYFEDASLVDPAKRDVGTTFRAPVDVTEWLGDQQYAYIPFEAPEAVRTQLRDLSRELDSDQLRTQAIVSIDATSRLREGREAEFWLDTRKVHVFDPATGENLTRDAEAGAELTRMVAEEREEQLDEAQGGGGRDVDLRERADGRTGSAASGGATAI